MRFKHKIAVITGSGQGIGEAIARAYTREGAHVIIADLKPERGQKLAQSIGGVSIPMDVSQTDQICNLMTEVMKQFGRLDILVANAGINLFSEPLAPGMGWRWSASTLPAAMGGVAGAQARAANK